MFPGVPLRWIPGHRFKENPKTSSLRGRVDIGACHTLANTPWLTAYLLLATAVGKSSMCRDPARRAEELLQLMTSLPSSGLQAPCAGGSSEIGSRGVSASIDNEDFLSAMAEVCKDAKCWSPVPGPLDTVTTWILLTRLGWRLEQVVFGPQQHHVLEVVTVEHFAVGMAVCGRIPVVRETSRA